MSNTFTVRIRNASYLFILASLILSSFYIPINIAKADLTTGPGTLNLSSASGTASSISFSGIGIGGDGWDDDCPIPPVTNHSFHAYVLSNAKWWVDSGAQSNFNLTTTQTGIGHNNCQSESPSTDRTYQYSFNKSDTVSLANGDHTLWVSATDGATGLQITDSYDFTVGGGGGGNAQINPSCTNTQSVAPGVSAVFNIALPRSDGSPPSPDSYPITSLNAYDYPAGSPNFNPAPSFSIPSGNTTTITTLTVPTTQGTTPGSYPIDVSINNIDITCSLTVTSGGGNNGNGGNPSADITANGAGGTVNVTAGSTATIAWSCTDASTYSVTGPSGFSSSGAYSAPGSTTSPAVSAGSTLTYNLTCTGGAGTTPATDSVIVTSANVAPGFSAKIEVSKSSGSGYGSSIVLASGSTGYVKVTKTIFGNNDCTVAPTGWNGSSSVHTVNNITSTVTYTLTCSLGGNVIVDSATINILTADLKIAGLDGPMTVDAGSYLVTWSSGGGAKSCRILPAIAGIPGGFGAGTQSQSGSPKYVSISANTTYTLTCSENLAGGGVMATDSVTVNITAPDFSLDCSATYTQSTPAGGSVAYSITATSIAGFNSQVALSVTAGLPSGASSNGINLTPTATGLLPVSTTISTTPGTYGLTVTATGGGKTHTCNLELDVTDPNGNPELDHLVLTPDPYSMEIGDIATYTSIAWYTDGSQLDVTTNPATQYSSSDVGVAEASSQNIFRGAADGVVTITSQYTETGVSVADTAQLTVGTGSLLTATLVCPSGLHTCSVPYNSAINLSWSSTGASECRTTPNLTPVASATSGIASTGALTGTAVFTLTCDGGAKGTPSATDSVTVTVAGAAGSLVTSDKDVTAINGVAVGSPSACSAGTDALPNVTFRVGDVVTYRINICNTGSDDISSISIVDQLTNLTQPPSGWNAQYNGSPITETIAVDSPPAPNQKLNFTIPGTIHPSPTSPYTGYLTFDAVVTKPAGTATLYRFQNTATISGSGVTWKVNTPLYLFTTGSKVPQKFEVAP